MPASAAYLICTRLCNRVGKRSPPILVCNRVGKIPLPILAPQAPVIKPIYRFDDIFPLGARVHKKALNPVNRTRALQSLYHLITAYSVFLASFRPESTSKRLLYTFPLTPGNASVPILPSSTPASKQHAVLSIHNICRNISARNLRVIFGNPILVLAPTTNIA